MPLIYLVLLEKYNKVRKKKNLCLFIISKLNFSLKLLLHIYITMVIYIYVLKLHFSSLNCLGK